MYTNPYAFDWFNFSILTFLTNFAAICIILLPLIFCGSWMSRIFLIFFLSFLMTDGISFSHFLRVGISLQFLKESTFCWRGQSRSLRFFFPFFFFSDLVNSSRWYRVPFVNFFQVAYILSSPAVWPKIGSRKEGKRKIWWIREISGSVEKKTAISQHILDVF